MIYLHLFLEFFKMGLFSFGGGYAILPMLEQSARSAGWLTSEEFVNMIAISQVTPGPIAINMATYVGFRTGGVLGSLIATVAVILPSMLIVIALARLFLHAYEHAFAQSMFYGLRPTVTALIAASAFQIGLVALFDAASGVNYQALLLTVAVATSSYQWNLHPILLLILAALFGILFF
ncbi:chromate transport protein [Candidatus Moduliflexus flocculans]|uniref:Chromate transport protein n=1 Tax=Candidatus Moduliflexus flocculans TaxID=1499966 RepID=A0A081BQT3_9BACT|nr:chromate transport protein [Candidatus Moduliflexus flocculans]